MGQAQKSHSSGASVERFEIGITQNYDLEAVFDQQPESTIFLQAIFQYGANNIAGSYFAGRVIGLNGSSCIYRFEGVEKGFHRYSLCNFLEPKLGRPLREVKGRIKQT
jgi:hypothetical protein